MGPLAFRHATEADVPALVALVTSAYRGPSSRAGWTTEADLLDGQRIDPKLLLQDLQRERSTVIVAEDGDAMLACVHVAELEGAGYLGMLAVRPEAQAAGIGSQLMAEAERHARQVLALDTMRMT